MSMYFQLLSKAKFIITGVFLIVWPFIMFGQKTQLTNITIPTPNASALGQFGETPVSYFSGTPEISVPIYTLQYSNYNLPINLSYYYNAMRPNMVPGWVGQGWMLDAGGMITRKQKSDLDECDRGPSFHRGYYFNYNQLNNSNWNTTSFLSAYFQGTSGYVGSPIIYYELEPDEFDFSFCGLTGSFYLDHTGQWRVKSERDIKIEFNNTFTTPTIFDHANHGLGDGILPAISKPFSGFTLTDENGIKYNFGENDNIEYSANWLDGNHFSSFAASSWYLTSIVLNNGQIITFKYVRGPFTCQLDKEYSYQENYHPGGSNSLDVPCGQDEMDALFNAKWNYSGKLLFPLYLESIESPNCKISFDISPSNAKYYSWDQYQVVAGKISGDPSNNYNNLITGNPVFADFTNKTILTPGTPGNEYSFKDFYVPYYQEKQTDLVTQPPAGRNILDYITRRFTWMKLNKIKVTSKFDNSTIKSIGFQYDEDPNKRLKLSEIQNIDAKNIIINKYNFKYNSLFLPDFLTDMTDHWGFYNGTNLNGATTANFFSYKNPNPNYAAAELLQEIDYPTGGSTQFISESNLYGKLIDTDDPQILSTASGTAGGVRIKSIINNDGTGKLTTTNYLYVKGYTPSADVSTLASSGELSGIPKYTFDNLNGTASDGSLVIYKNFTSEPIIPLTVNSAGSFIGYSEVVEKRSDNSYTIHKFTNYSDGPDFRDALVAPSSSLSPNELPYLPRNERYEMRGKLTSTTMFNASGQTVFQKQLNNYQQLSNTHLENYIRSVKAIIFPVCGTHWINQASANQLNLYSYIPMQTLTRTYNGSNVLEQESDITYDDTYKKVISTSATTSDNNKIVHDYTYPFDYTDNISQQMVAKNELDAVITDNSKKETSSGTKKIISTKAQYNSWGTGLLLPQIFSQGSFNNNLEDRVHNYMYDKDGNVICTSKENDMKVSYDYRYLGQYPVVKIINAENTQTSTDVSQNTMGFAQIIIPKTASNGYSNNYVTTFNVDRLGTTTLTAGFTAYPGSGAFAQVDCELYGPNNFSDVPIPLCVNNGASSACTNFSYTKSYTNLQPGQYTLKAYFYDHQNLACDVYVNVSNPTITTTTTVSGIKEFFYEGFEEDATASNTNPYAGIKCHIGSFTVPYTRPTNRKYKIDYYYLQNGVWYPVTKDYIDNMILSDGSAVDEVRVHPVDALMTTYTYIPLRGMTSKCEPNNSVNLYEYDNFGRLKLIRDQNKNILTQYEYTYQANLCSNNVDVTATNTTNSENVTVSFKNRSNQQITTVLLPVSNASTPLKVTNLCPGSYDITVINPEVNFYNFNICNSVHQNLQGSNTFSNIQIDQNNCNTISFWVF